jgi:hypothetical protein
LLQKNRQSYLSNYWGSIHNVTTLAKLWVNEQNPYQNAPYDQIIF